MSRRKQANPAKLDMEKDGTQNPDNNQDPGKCEENHNLNDLNEGLALTSSRASTNISISTDSSDFRAPTAPSSLDLTIGPSARLAPSVTAMDVDEGSTSGSLDLLASGSLEDVEMMELPPERSSSSVSVKILYTNPRYIEDSSEDDDEGLPEDMRSNVDDFMIMKCRGQQTGGPSESPGSSGAARHGQEENYSSEGSRWSCLKRVATRPRSASPTGSAKRFKRNDDKAYSDGENNSLAEPYACSICQQKFARSSSLDEHMQTHTDQLQFTCSYCPRLFKHKRSRDRHTKLHTGDKKYKCQQCDSAFSRSDHLKIHMKTHDSRKPYKCGSCNRGYNTAAALSSHQQSHLKQESRSGQNSDGSSPSPGLFHCFHCTESFSKIEFLQNHLMVIHNEKLVEKTEPEDIKIVCMYCSKEFLSLDQMYQHVNVTHKDVQNGVASASPPREIYQNGHPASPKPKHACDRCTMGFDNPELLKEHIKTSHWGPTVNSSSDTYTAALLEKSYSPFAQTQPTDLSRKKPSARDATCDKSAKRKKEQDSPFSVSPYDANDKPCICSCCYAQLPNFKSFLLHMETHMASSNSSLLGFCPVCGEPGREPVSFTNHIFGHAIAQVPGSCCYVCNKTFENAEALQKHLADMHVVSVFKCTICNEMLDSKMSMQMHISTKHSDECNHFKCYLCNNQVFHDRLSAELHISMKHYYQFAATTSLTNQSLLRTHYQLELDSRLRELGLIFHCTFCQKTFKDKYSQYIHILKEHNDSREGEKYLLETAFNTPRQTPSISPTYLFPPRTMESPETKLDVTKTPEPVTCNICNRNDLASESDLLLHKKIQHSKTKSGSVSLQCAYCNEFCKSRNDLENHMKTHQVSGGKAKHKCNICDEIFSSGLTLADHKLTHCKIVDGNNCVQCKATLVDEQSFYSHQLQHSNGLAKPNSQQISLPANCIICCQTLQTDLEIKLHSNFHLKRLLHKEHLCGGCSKVFDTTTGETLKDRSPSDQITVSLCKDCKGKSSPDESESNKFQTFNNENHGIVHMLNEGANVECRLCKQAFASPVKLQTHLIEHNFYGMNQYSCYVCSSVFTAASGLQSHMIGHGLDHRPYDCSHCQMKFFFRAELDNHRYVHFVNSPNGRTPTPNYNGTVEMSSAEQYQTCSFCSNTFLNNALFAEHIAQCSYLSRGKDSFSLNVSDNNIVKQEVESDDGKKDEQ